MAGRVVRLFILPRVGSAAADKCDRMEACVMKPTSTNTFNPGPTLNTPEPLVAES
jgi:hypothetical protein